MNSTLDESLASDFSSNSTASLRYSRAVPLDHQPAHYRFTFPSISPTREIAASTGTSIVLLGANGSGKSRLGAHVETETNHNNKTLRISAHRALRLPDNFPIQNYLASLSILHVGTDQTSTHHIQAKRTYKWQNQPVQLLQDDYTILLTTLFAEDYQVMIDQQRDKAKELSACSRLDVAIRVWNALLPRRQLIKGAGYLEISGPSGSTYKASDASDGERVILYMLGQCLLAPDLGVIIIDEPELHIHKSIMQPFWGAVEAARPDCLFIYITHDLEFAKSKRSSQKYWIRSYDGESWDVIHIDSAEQMPEALFLEVLGGRHPILFVEGETGSIDLALYSSCYPGWTIIPRGPCREVMRAVAGVRGLREEFYTECRGIIDRDERDSASEMPAGVHMLDYAELENLLLDERIFRQAGAAMGYSTEEIERKFEEAKRIAIHAAKNDLEDFCERYALSAITNRLKDT